MKILFAASEMSPLARTGGLGDVLQAFPAEMQQRGHEVSVVLPFYREIREHAKLQISSTGVLMSVQVGSKRLDCEVLQAVAENGVQLFFVKRDEYFDRRGIYGADGRPYEDNAERFIYFSKAVVELARRIKPGPDVVHVHDWQTALVPVFIKDRGLPFKSVLTIHNLAYQGSFWSYDFGLTNLPGDYFSAKGVEFFGALNFLKGGILYADAVTTVSGHYAREIQTVEGGCGLDAVLREQSFKLTGILNGADEVEWNPATDKYLPRKYKASSLLGKRTCRNALLKELALDKAPGGPVFAMVSRLAEQKGFEIFLPLLDRLLSDDVRLIIMGEGDPAFERDLLLAEKRYRGRFHYLHGYDDRLAHLMQGGADLILAPSRFEPCGLTAMYALKYGTIPVARATGGLHQIVMDCDATNDSGNGFLFFDYRPEALWDAIGRAKKAFADPELWREIMQRAMQANFSWEHAALEYEKIYGEIVGEPVSRLE
jgi:starch synthase